MNNLPRIKQIDRRAIRLALLFALFAILGFFASRSVVWRLIQPTAKAATTFTVNSIADTADSSTADGVCNDGSGACTLRAAIEQANATAGTDTINFSIGSGVKTIIQTSDFPMITDPLVIDGTTQPGFAGTPIIEINGNNRSNTFRAALFITAGSSTIKGLVINRSDSVAIAITTNGGNHIEGNYIGTDVTGNVRLPNSDGVIVNTAFNTVGGSNAAARNVISGNIGAGLALNVGDASDNVIQGNYIGVNANGTVALSNSGDGIRLTGLRNQVGGTTPGAGNVISGNSGSGLLVGGQMTTVQGNFVGTDATGTVAVPNAERGIRVSNSPNNTIGGTSPAARNLISGNRGAGISIDDTGSGGNVIQGNLIGTDISGFVPLPNTPGGIAGNSSGGIFINRGVNNLIGGTTPGAGNTIAFNGSSGVRVITLNSTGAGVNNRISRNSIFGTLGLGIELGDTGVAPNDSGDSDRDANLLQNFPVITSVITNAGSTTINGTLGSRPNTSYELEFFSNSGCAPLGNGEGAQFVASHSLVTDANGNASFSVITPSAVPRGRVIAATATDPAGNTSEFSSCSSNAATGLAVFGLASQGAKENVGMLSIPVKRISGSSGTLTVDYASVNGTAIAGQDYGAVSGTLTFADGETSKTILLPIFSDTLTENPESLSVRLSSSSSPGVVGASGIIEVMIFDPNTLSVLSVNTSSQLEGDSGSTNHLITVTLSPATGETVTVNYQTNAMTATSGVDFQPVSGMLTFPPGTSSQTVSVPVIGDRIDEPDEMFRLSLSNAVNAGISVSSNPPRATIVDDDAPPSLSVNDVGVVEGTSGTTNAVFTVSLSSQTAQAVSVNFTTADGTATAGQDYQSTSGTIGFSAGETSKTVTVLVNADTIAEPLETFFLNLTGPVNATLLDAQGTATIGSANSAAVGFSAASYQAVESDHAALITIVRSGDTASALSIDYGTVNGTASDKSDYATAIGTLQFAGNESSKTFLVLLSEDAFQEGNESVGLTLSNISSNAFIVGPNSAVLIIGDSTTSANNPIDTATGFVRQHYHDFLNREPDANGFIFWTNQITSCGNDVQCTEVRRIDVSASFFLSIEFQQSGYLVERFYKVGYGDATGTSTLGSNHPLAVPIVRFNEFLKDTQRIGRGVIVLQPGWEQALENNKQAFAAEFVQTSRFISALPISMTPAEFIDKLNQNAGMVLSASERTTAINLFGGAGNTNNNTARAQALRQVAEDTDLYNAEFNRAFVLAQYFGYLRRNPNDAPETTLDYTGYDFWLTKLNQFNGNYINAEMVKAFLSSIEYRQRFGP